ncbi:MAG: cytochrome c [Gillisia sp.]
MKKYLWLWAAISLVACKGNAGKNEEGIVENQPKNIQHADSSSVEVQDSTLIAAIAKGKEVYAQNCVVCHQSGGGGVPNMNPPLKETEYVLGEKKELISIILKGSSAGLEVNGQTYSNNMPAFADNLKDIEIANVLTYVRNNFGNKASAISEKDVAVVRDSIFNKQ